MSFLKKQKFAVLVIALIAIFVSQSINVCCAEITFQEKSLSFMTDVAGLDLAAYKTELTDYNTDQPKNDGDVFREEVHYTLESNGNSLGVSLQFMNRSLTRYDLYPIKNSILSPIYVQSSSGSAISIVTDFLERYQTFSSVSTVSEARDCLKAITEMKSQNITAGNLRLQIAVTEDNSTFFIWTRAVNGLDFATGLSIRIRNGVLDMFDDKSNFLKIGNADINISKENAVSIAWSQTKTFTSLNISMGDSFKIILFALKDEPKTTRLMVNSRSQEPFTMYPFWYIEFSAEQIQYGVNGAEVGVWADTGEIAYAHLTGYQGIISDPESSLTPTPASATLTERPSTQSSEFPQVQQNNNTNLLSNELVISLAASIAVIAIILAVILMKRKT